MGAVNEVCDVEPDTEDEEAGFESKRNDDESKLYQRLLCDD